MNTMIKNYKKTIQMAAIVAVGLFFFAILAWATGILQGTDDAVLSGAMHHYTVASWVSRQYDIWSGRVTAESLIVIIYNLPLTIWRIVQLAMYGVLIFTLYNYYKLLGPKKRTDAKDLLVLAVCTVAPFLMAVGALRWGAFWITGSLNYFWIAVGGLVAFYPLLYVYIQRKLPHLGWMVVGIISAALAAMGQEQVYALLSLFSILAVGGLFWKTKKIWIYPLIQLIITGIASMISYFAPGNKHRFASEMATYIPTFHSAPLHNRIDWSYRWFMDATINHLGFILPVVWILIVVLIFAMQRKKSLGKVNTAIVIVLTVAASLYLKLVPGNIFNFYVAWGVHALPKVSYIYLLLWTGVLVVTVAGLYRISRYYLQKVFLLPLMFLGVLIGSALMVLSPTMYASGERTMFIPASIGALLIAILASYALTEYWRFRTVIVSGLTFLAVLTYLMLSAELVQKIKDLNV